MISVLSNHAYEECYSINLLQFFKPLTADNCGIKMKILHLGIILGVFIVMIFTINTALMQKPDSSIQSYSNKTISEDSTIRLDDNTTLMQKPYSIQSHSNATIKDLTIRLGGNTTGVYYPMYNLHELPQVLAAKRAFPIVPFNVNINPASGPGTEPSAAWTNAITQLKDAGAVVIGYVPTGYGNRTVANVEDMILAYHQFYPELDGIMFDEVSSSSSQFTFYQTISNYTRSIGFSYIRANPGSSIYQGDIALFNHVTIYESSGYPDESTLLSRTFYPQYSKSAIGFGVTIHSQPTYNSTWLHMSTKYLKWIYITEQTEPNPYEVFPSYFNQYLNDISSLDIVPATNNLINFVKIMNFDKGETTSLDYKVQKVINSLDSNNNTEAKNQLNAFIHEVNAQIGKKITQDQSNQLMQYAQSIINSIQ